MRIVRAWVTRINAPLRSSREGSQSLCVRGDASCKAVVVLSKPRFVKCQLILEPTTIPAAPRQAKYFSKQRYNVNELEPVVAKPHSPDNKALAKDCRDTKIDRVYIGSCTGGKTEDFAAAARVLQNKKASTVEL